MRIVIDARCVADRFPGIGRYIYSLLVALAELEPPHRMIVLYNPGQRNTRHDMAALRGCSAIELFPIELWPFSLAEQLAIPLLLRQLRADLYHAPYYVRPYATLTCPSVVTLYDAIPRLFPHEVSLRARLLFDLLTRLAIGSSRRVIAISASACADIVAAYGLPRERIAVTPLAADPRFRPQPPDRIAAVRERYQLPERYVLSLGSNKPHKNLPRLVAAWAQVVAALAGEGSDPAFKPALVIAGHWDPRYPQVRRLVAAHCLEEWAHFVPDVAESDLPALYSGATLFAFPSLYEGFGLPVLEAMACGVPVLCGHTSSLVEVAGDAGLLVDPTSSTEIASGLIQLLNDAALRLRYAQAGLQRAASFSWRRTAEATLALYERVLTR